ncbi:MAG TPA: heme peroxidase family protein [Polyangiaceae bacterium]|nr:heme peroxidase family protein [Polyangiaceae bacterium]
MAKKHESATRGHGGLRGLKYVNGSSISGGRFGRMFRWLPGETYERKDLENLAKQMIQLESATLRTSGSHVPSDEKFSEGPDILLKHVKPGGKLLDTAFGESEAGDENPTVPAGYTYFGQFIDHDLTFDPNSSLQKENDPDALEDFRTPRFDLDSVYGRGPDDQPYLYDHGPGGDGFHFLLGRDDAGKLRVGELPRNVDGRALLGDPRNDENVLVCQLQAVFLNFHNKVFDTLSAAPRPDRSKHDIFLETQRIVRWHYQYLVMNDYLPRIVGKSTADKVLKGGPHGKPHLEFYKPKLGEAYMPVEFSVAAFRFGHSMVRPSYALRPGEQNVGGSQEQPFSGDRQQRFHRIPVFSDVRDRGANLSGFGKLFPRWEIDWNLFFCKKDMPHRPAPDGEDKGMLEVFNTKTQPSYRIDTKLVDPLAMLPPNVAGDGIPVLAYRNLIRGSEFALPSGQSVATALGLRPLSHEELWADVGDDKDDTFRNPKTNPFAYRAPLWFYILKEAERQKRHGFENDTKGGHHLGEVGGRVVAEVLVGICESDHTSYLYQDSTWTPDKEKAKSGFDPRASLKTMFELIEWTTGGDMTFLR